MRAYIYYVTDDNAFERAAKMEAGVSVSDASHQLLAVETKEEFISAWQQIKDTAETATATVDSVALFVHASKQDDSGDGLEFAALDGASGTLLRDEMGALVRLPWTDVQSVRLLLFGCNTGLRGGRGWCPAEHLAQTQLVPARGETGYSYFSKQLNTYEAQVASDQSVYLHAYKRGKNDALGDGSKMPTRAYDPYIRDSVGTGGTNNSADVLAVQQLLNDVPSSGGGPTAQLTEDGIIGPNTINAIKHFQMTHFGFEDGRVDPGEKTLIKLVEFRPE